MHPTQFYIRMHVLHVEDDDGVANLVRRMLDFAEPYPMQKAPCFSWGMNASKCGSST